MIRSFHIADLFCGAGGTSAGACQAAETLGYKPALTAINHWPVAIETHTRNHPEARHLCTTIDNVNPRDLFRPGELNLLWASPECTHHSVARGGKPIHEQSRATAWCVIRWADALRPPVILVENVPEFEGWGPLDARGRPLKSRKGEVFQSWVANLRALGYKVDWRVLCAADFGDPTTRRRLFIQAVRGQRKIAWPLPTHTPTGGASTLKWRAAREIIDWELKGRWIDEMKPQERYGGLPLSPNSLKRINTGFFKHGLKNFIIEASHGNGSDPNGDGRRVHSVEKPLGTLPCSNRFALAEAFIIPQHGSNAAKSVDSPAPTVTTTSRGIMLVEPFIVPNFGERTGQEPRSHSVDGPLPSVTSHGAGALVEPFLACLEHGGSVRDIDRPMPTITTAKGGAIAVVEPYLVKLRGTSKDQIEKHSASSIDCPTPTITAGGGHLALAEPFLVQMNHAGGDRVRCIDNPLPTVCGNRGEMALIEAALLPQQSGGELRPVSRPCPTISTSGAVALVEPYVVEYYGTGESRSVDDPLSTVTTRHRHALVSPEIIIDGKHFRVRYRYRMLQPRELAGAQGFSLNYEFSGNKTEQVKQIGNAVPCGLARALVNAVLSKS